MRIPRHRESNQNCRFGFSPAGAGKETDPKYAGSFLEAPKPYLSTLSWVAVKELKLP